VTLQWEEFFRLTTAIGAQTLTIRGSDKSMYGKIFERLVLGTVLTLLGFRFVPDGAAKSVTTAGLFWLSDSNDNRECDATVLVTPGNFVRFDIGFIGPGNPEISKDKLSRFASERIHEGKTTYSKTIVVVDTLPRTTKTIEAAKAIGADIIQMSMKFWPIELAQKLEAYGWNSDLARVPEVDIAAWLDANIAAVNLLPLIGDVHVDAQNENDNAE
jgi:hypothetical protein